jgi:putative CocE/NonD family hydrolase
MRLRVLVVGLSVGAALLVPSAGRASGCVPGKNGCFPTSQQCATGDYNGFWNGNAVGRAALCVATGGHVLVYAGGSAPNQCGDIVVGDQVVSGDTSDDPNDCSPPPVAPSGRYYLTMFDGTPLALYISFPPGWHGERLPSILQYDGYDGGGRPAFIFDARVIDPNNYIVVHLGARGAGCSGGQWSLFSEQNARDGAAVVEWMAAQPWSNGDVGYFGHSYSGILGILVAAQRPAHLRAISVGGVFDDLYRDITFPGGIQSLGFATQWHFQRRLNEHRYGTLPATEQYDPRCAEHVAARPAETETETAIKHTLLDDQDNDWWAEHSLRRVISSIDVPLQIVGMFQDEETQGRGPALLWQRATVGRKQLLLTNGDHDTWLFGRQDEDPTGTASYTPDWIVQRAMGDWLDHYVAGVANGVESQPRVRVFLESHPVGDHLEHTGELDSDTFPLSGTSWTRLFAGPNGTLEKTAPGPGSGSDQFLNGIPRHLVAPADGYRSSSGTYPGQGLFWTSGSDAVIYRTPAATQTSTVAGPMEATLYATIGGVDAELMVQVADEDPAGNLSLLQRGLLKASHRAVDPAKSWYDGHVMYRPYHTHRDPQLLTPGAPVRLDVEIWPIAFVIRPGHRLVMIVTTPPAQNSVNTYAPRGGIETVQIRRDAAHPTNLLVPFVATPADLGAEPPCGTQLQIFCERPLH